MKKRLRFAALLLLPVLVCTCGTASGPTETNTPAAAAPTAAATIVPTATPEKEKTRMEISADQAYLADLEKNGDEARIAALMKKAQEGGSYTVCAFGGSISSATGASDQAHGYGNVVCRWWQENFPKATFTYVNAGLGATNPEMACFRYEQDVLPFKPDFTVIDFAVNTFLDNRLSTSYPTLLTRLLNDDSAVMAIIFSRTVQAQYKQGEYAPDTSIPEKAIAQALEDYKIPSVNFHAYLWDLIDKGAVTWPEAAADWIHPNNEGHRMAAGLICSRLAYIKEHLSDYGTPEENVPAPKKDILLHAWALTNKSEGIRLSGSVHASGDNDAPHTRGWRFETGTGTLTFTVPENAEEVYLLVAGTGNSTLTAQSGDRTKKVTAAELYSNTLVRLVAAPGASVTVTVRSEANSHFDLYYVGLRKGE